jgi:hypothetical protein
MNASTASFVGFVVLNSILAGGVGYWLWRKLPVHPKRIPAAIAAASVTAFALGALWFSLVHVHTFDPVPPNVPQGDNTQFGKVVFAGVVGVLLLVLAGVIGLAGYGLYPQVARKVPPNAPDTHREDPA